MDGVFDGTKVPSGRRGYNLEVGYKLDLFCSLHIGRRVQVYGFGCDGNVIWLISHALEYFHVRAVGDYEPQALDELNLKTGDIVRVYRVTNG